MNERANEMLASYRSDTAPTTEREDALFEAIVVRIVSSDTEDAGLSAIDLDADFDEDELAALEADLDRWDDDECHDDHEAHPPASLSAARKRRGLLLPVAVATAAIAAGLVLAISAQGRVFTEADEAVPWQANSVEEDAPWWERIVPRTLLDDAEVEPDASTPDEDVVADDDVLGAAAAEDSMPGAAGPTWQGPARGSQPGVGAPAVAPTTVPAATSKVSEPDGGWVAPLYDPRPSNPRGVPSSQPQQAGGGLPSAPSDPDPGKDDDGAGGKGDDGPSAPTPTPSSGSGGGDTGAGDAPPPPDEPPPPDPPKPGPPSPDDDPDEPPAEGPCEMDLMTCWQETPDQNCDETYAMCVGGEDPCELDYEACVAEAGLWNDCDAARQACYDGGGLLDPCVDNFGMCAGGQGEHEQCLEEFSWCAESMGTLMPEDCDHALQRCESLGLAVPCGELLPVCEMYIDPLMQCDQELDNCMAGGPGAEEMCFEAHDECVNEATSGPGSQQQCESDLELCMIEGDPESCEAEWHVCVN